MCNTQSEFHPLVGNEEDFKIVCKGDAVMVIFRTFDGVEQSVIVPMRPAPKAERLAA